VRYSREKVIDSKQPCGRHAEWDSEVVQLLKGLWLHSAGHRRQGRFLHISTVERAGFTSLAEGAKVTFDFVPNRDKESAEILRVT
jgi:hypothetical protein